MGSCPLLRRKEPAVSNYTNDGIFAPGASPGTLTVQGDFGSTANARLDIELDGLIQGTEYDLLAITGNADFNGDLQVTLNFDADINDEFIISTTTGTINNCNLPNQVFTSFGGFNYTFDVVCRNNNELVLTVVNETLSIPEENLSSVSLYPNPSKDMVSISDESINNVEVYDLNGRMVLFATTPEFSVNTLLNGVYFVIARNSEGALFVKKLIKN